MGFWQFRFWRTILSPVSSTFGFNIGFPFTSARAEDSIWMTTYPLWSLHRWAGMWMKTALCSEQVSFWHSARLFPEPKLLRPAFKKCTLHCAGLWDKTWHVLRRPYVRLALKLLCSARTSMKKGYLLSNVTGCNPEYDSCLAKRMEPFKVVFPFIVKTAEGSRLVSFTRVHMKHIVVAVLKVSAYNACVSVQVHASCFCTGVISLLILSVSMLLGLAWFIIWVVFISLVPAWRSPLSMSWSLESLCFAARLSTCCKTLELILRILWSPVEAICLPLLIALLSVPSGYVLCNLQCLKYCVEV